MGVSVKDLENFILESQFDLVEIKESLNEFNIFNVLGVQRREIRHSNFLGWLFDPNGSHLLGAIFLKDLLNLISKSGSLNSEKMEDLIKQDLSETIVHRESLNNIDILIINESADFVICIENKIDANFSGHQLAKYYKFVEKKFSKITHRCYVTLTPFNTNYHNLFECGNMYKNISYIQIINLLHQQQEIINNAKSTVKESINQYCTMVQKDITQTNPEVRMAQKIYKKHKDAIEFILNHKPNFSGLNYNIWNCLLNKEIDGFIFTVEKPNDAIVRILPDNDELLSIFKKPEFHSWNNEYMFCLEIIVEYDRVWVRWSFGNINNDSRADELLTMMSHYYDIMDNMEVFQRSGLPVDMHKDQIHMHNYPGVCGVKLFNDVDFINQDKTPIELFKIKFAELNEKLIQPWTEACIKHLRN